MDDKARSLKINKNMVDFDKNEDAEMDLRRGPWTVEEDFKLINYITTHGEGRWNTLARCAGLKRTGKSCRLRWLNYLRPDVRRGNITLEEQLLILELHSSWGNRWSKIAQYLPGRTDNEIKNYWRTRVQKHAKQLRCDVNSQQFKDTMRYIWMPRLVERIQAASISTSTSPSDQLMMTRLNNMEHLGFMSNPNGNIMPDNPIVGLSPVSDLSKCHVASEGGKIGNNYNSDQQMSRHDYLDNNRLLNGDVSAMHEQRYVDWFEDINGIHSYSSDSFWNSGSDQDFWLSQQHLQNNGSFSIEKKNS